MTTNVSAHGRRLIAQALTRATADAGYPSGLER
jgi:hypothetical protein